MAEIVFFGGWGRGGGVKYDALYINKIMSIEICNNWIKLNMVFNAIIIFFEI